MKLALSLTGIVLLMIAVYISYMLLIANPRVESELRQDPEGERAARVTLLTFADGKTIPVNYLREGNTIYVGADGPWWRAFRGEGAPVTLLVRGETLQGSARVVLDDQAFVEDVFARLRPAAPAWLPDWLNGKLVVIRLAKGGP